MLTDEDWVEASQGTPSRVKSWDEGVDVVIIGSGFAGLAAAIEARNAGASVVILEKNRTAGGNSSISDGGIAAAGTRMQKKAGIEDSPERMYADMLKAGMGLNHPDLVREVAEKSNEVFEWSMDDLGVEYLDRIDQFGGHSVPRCYTALNVSGATIVRRQLARVRKLGVEVRLRTRFQTFVRNADGRVGGVVTRADGGEKRLEARKAVVLAAGGFGSDHAFRVAQDPRLTAAIDSTNRPSATAEVLKAAMKTGATPVQLSHIQLGPWASPDEKGFGAGPRFADYIVFLYGIILDPNTGLRFINELADRKQLADAILSVGRPCIGLADAGAVAQAGWSIAQGLKKGVVKAFDTLAELADAYGLPPGAVQGSVARYNRHVAQGHDAEWGKPIVPDAPPMTSAPYYAMRLWPKVHHTMGGVQINVKGQVIDLNQEPIPGLYAAGEVVGGVHGACRLGSCAITDCLVFGRNCGRNAAAEMG